MSDDAPLLLTASDAAGRLSISPRTLWTLTDRGEMPVVRIGRAVRYDVRDLIAWIDANKTTSLKENPAHAQ